MTCCGGAAAITRQRHRLMGNRRRAAACMGATLGCCDGAGNYTRFLRGAVTFALGRRVVYLSG
ncbi:MAG: hypothetical protein Kow00120_16870 [Anaerolineae bacterium]